MSQAQKMRTALSKHVIPNLVANGFVGKYPHYRRIYDDRIELLVFQTNKYGNSFAVEISTVFSADSKRNRNFCSPGFESVKNDDLTVWHTNVRYRLKGMFDGWFYYTDVYRQKVKSMTFYKAVSETRAKNYTPLENEILVQKADDDIYLKVCMEVNTQMGKAFEWWDAFNRNSRFKLLQMKRT